MGEGGGGGGRSNTPSPFLLGILRWTSIPSSGEYTLSFVRTSNFAAEVEPKLNVLIISFSFFETFLACC